MALYVNLPAYPQYILPDLLDITDNDGGLGDDVAYEKHTGAVLPDWRRITYAQNNRSFAANIVNAIVNQDLYAVNITAVDSKFLAPAGKPIYITEMAAFTYAPWQTGWLDPDLDQIAIYYDVYDCNGANYWVRGQHEEKVTFPTYMILFHELSHVAHILAGTFRKDSNKDFEEQFAVDDENTFRTEHINPLTGQPQPLPLRSGRYLGGCGFSVPPEQMKTPNKKNSYCFVAMAALGRNSPRLDEVGRLEASYTVRSALTAQLLEQLKEQYYKFSPPIAAAMNESPELRWAIHDLIVEPLLWQFAAVERYIDDQLYAGQVTLPQSLAATVSRLVGTGKSHSLVTTLLDFKRTFAHGWSNAMDVDPFDGEPSSVLMYVLVAIARSEQPNSRLLWGMVDPLIIFWTTVSGHSNDSVDMDQMTTWKAAVESWLGESPIPDTVAELTNEELVSELSRLGETVFRSTDLRRRIARRLTDLAEEGGWRARATRALGLAGYGD